MMPDVQLREAARAIYDSCYPSDDWTPCSFDDAERYGTIHYRQAVGAAQRARAVLAIQGQQRARRRPVTRRKGERPVVLPPDRWSPSHPVAHMIATGDHWFDAWLMQKATPFVSLTKITGIPVDRLLSLGGGGPVLRGEVDALARAWSIGSPDAGVIDP